MNFYHLTDNELTAERERLYPSDPEYDHTPNYHICDDGEERYDDPCAICGKESDGL